MTENLENIRENIIEHLLNNPHHYLIIKELQERANLSNAEMDVLLRFCIEMGGEIFAKEFKSMVSAFYDRRRN